MINAAKKKRIVIDGIVKKRALKHILKLLENSDKQLTLKIKALMIIILLIIFYIIIKYKKNCYTILNQFNKIIDLCYIHFFINIQKQNNLNK